jgi:excisionase family DNA binding protein
MHYIISVTYLIRKVTRRLRNGENLAEYGDILRPEDVQKILHVGRNTVYRYLAEGTIKSIRIGNQYRVPKLYLIDFIYPGSAAGKEKIV